MQTVILAFFKAADIGDAYPYRPEEHRDRKAYAKEAMQECAEILRGLSDDCLSYILFVLEGGRDD